MAVQAEQRTVYVARYTTKDGKSRVKTCLTKHGAASRLAWWVIFDKRADDNGILDSPSELVCICDVQWTMGVAFFGKSADCDVHGYDGYYNELHDRFTRYILATQAVQP